LIERMRRPKYTTMILFSNFVTLSSNSSGVVGYALPFSLSSEGLANVEWTSYASNLWSQARIVHAQIQILPYFDEVKSGYTGSPMGIGTNLTTIIAPTTLGLVLDNGDSKLYNIMNDTTKEGFRKEIGFSNLEYGAAANLSSTVQGGAPGCLQVFGNQYPASTVVGIIRYTYIYQVKNRI